MAPYTRQKWFELFRSAMMELRDAAMHKRISLARDEIAARLMRLGERPGTVEEREALHDALRSLASLEKLQGKSDC